MPSVTMRAGRSVVLNVTLTFPRSSTRLPATACTWSASAENCFVLMRMAGAAFDCWAGTLGQTHGFGAGLAAGVGVQGATGCKPPTNPPMRITMTRAAFAWQQPLAQQQSLASQ